MALPKKRVYRVCPACSSPIPLHDDECKSCGHSLLQQPADTEAEQILNGKVFYNGQWVKIEEKLKHEDFIEKQLLAGKVEFNGKWVTVEEKAEKLKNTLPDESQKIVHFPIKPMPGESQTKTLLQKENLSEEENDSSPQWVKSKAHRKVAVIILSILSLLTMIFAGLGIIFSKWLPN